MAQLPSALLELHRMRLYVAWVFPVLCPPIKKPPDHNPLPFQAVDSYLSSASYNYYDQINVFNNDTELVAPKADVLQEVRGHNHMYFIWM